MDTAQTMSNDKQSRIDTLFSSYRASLAPLMLELESMWNDLNRQWNAELAAEFDRKVHGLAGSAATFDLAVIGDAARELEHTFNPLLDMNKDDARLVLVEELFQQLKKTIESHQ